MVFTKAHMLVLWRVSMRVAETGDPGHTNVAGRCGSVRPRVSSPSSRRTWFSSLKLNHEDSMGIVSGRLSMREAAGKDECLQFFYALVLWPLLVRCLLTRSASCSWDGNVSWLCCKIADDWNAFSDWVHCIWNWLREYWVTGTWDYLRQLQLEGQKFMQSNKMSLTEDNEDWWLPVQLTNFRCTIFLGIILETWKWINSIKVHMLQCNMSWLCCAREY